MESFDSLKEAQMLVESWRHHYNTERPHSALNYQTPHQFIRQWEISQQELRKTA